MAERNDFMTNDEIIEVVMAHKAGKKIQESLIHMEAWFPVSDPCWNFPKYKYRVAPEPPKPKLVPWTLETVPVDAVIRLKGGTRSWSRIREAHDSRVLLGGYISYDELLENYEWSRDGKTWHPCGTEVGA